jgi:hypothetical protein
MNLLRLLDAISEILSARYEAEITARVQGEEKNEVGLHPGTRSA